MTLARKVVQYCPKKVRTCFGETFRYSNDRSVGVIIIVLRQSCRVNTQTRSGSVALLHNFPQVVDHIV